MYHISNYDNNTIYSHSSATLNCGSLQKAAKNAQPTVILSTNSLVRAEPWFFKTLF